MRYIVSLQAAEKHISAKIFKENLHTSVKILQICMDLQDSVQRSLQNPAEKSCRSAQIRKDRKPGNSFHSLVDFSRPTETFLVIDMSSVIASNDNSRNS